MAKLKLTIYPSSHPYCAYRTGHRVRQERGTQHRRRDTVPCSWRAWGTQHRRRDTGHRVRPATQPLSKKGHSHAQRNRYPTRPIHSNSRPLPRARRAAPARCAHPTAGPTTCRRNRRHPDHRDRHPTRPAHRGGRHRRPGPRPAHHRLLQRGRHPGPPAARPARPRPHRPRRRPRRPARPPRQRQC